MVLKRTCYNNNGMQQGDCVHYFPGVRFLIFVVLEKKYFFYKFKVLAESVLLTPFASLMRLKLCLSCSRSKYKSCADIDLTSGADGLIWKTCLKIKIFPDRSQLTVSPFLIHT